MLKPNLTYLARKCGWYNPEDIAVMTNMSRPKRANTATNTVITTTGPTPTGSNIGMVPMTPPTDKDDSDHERP